MCWMNELQIVPYFTVYSVHPHLWPKLSEEKIFRFNFLIQLFIYFCVDTWFLYFKGILAFIFENTDTAFAF